MDFLIGAGVFVSSLGAAYYLYQQGSAKRDKTLYDAYNKSVYNYLARRESLINSLASQGKGLKEISDRIDRLMGTDFPSLDDFDL